MKVNLLASSVSSWKRRAIQQARFASVNKPNVLVNGNMGLSARAYHHILKLSRTIADLAEAL